MLVVFLGTPQAAVPSLEALLASRHEVAAVVTRPDKPRDRAGGRPSPSPVKLAAEAAGLPVVQPERGRDPQLPATLAAFGAEIGVTCAFGLLPPPVLQAFPRGLVNVHFSLLPAYRGAAPVQRALLDGVTVTGVTIFQLDEGMDTGPVLSAVEVPVEPGEDAGLAHRPARRHRRRATGGHPDGDRGRRSGSQTPAGGGRQPRPQGDGT